MSEFFLASDTVNKCIQPCLSEETYVLISAAGTHVYTCTEIAQEQYVLVKLLPLPPPSLPQPHHGQSLGEPRLFGQGVETTQVQHAWMPPVCLFSGSEPSSHSSSFPVVLCFLSFFPGPRLQWECLPPPEGWRTPQGQKMAFWRGQGAPSPHRGAGSGWRGCTPLPSSTHSAAQLSW